LDGTGIGVHIFEILPRIEDKDRTAQSEEDMAKEAAWLANTFAKE
jgi:hypothetical protein